MTVTERRLLAVGQFTIALCLLVLFPVAFGISIPSIHRAPELLAWLFWLSAAGRIIWLVYSGRPRLFDMVFWVFVYIFWGLAADVQIASGRYPIFLKGGGYSDSMIVTTQTRIAVGIAAYVVGVWAWNQFTVNRESTGLWDKVTISEDRVRIVGIVGILTGLYEIHKIGLHTFFSSRYTLTNAVTNLGSQVAGYNYEDAASKASGVLTSVFLTVPSFVALIYILVSGLWRRNKTLTVALIAINIIVNNPISQPRAQSGVVAVGLLAVLVDLRKRPRIVYFALGLLLSLLLSLSYLNVFRAPETESGSVTEPSISQELSQSPDFGMFQQEINGTAWVQTEGFTNGRQLAGSALVFVPRALWSSKPQSTGVVVSQLADLNGNWSSSFWTEFYIDFGYPELIAAMVLVGYLFTRLDRQFEASHSAAAKVAIPTLATYTVILVRGSLQPEFGFMLPLVLVFLVCLKRTGRPARPGAAGLLRDSETVPFRPE